MCFIRDLNFLIHLIVLLLFVLQRIDAECETNPEKVKQKFLESFQSIFPAGLDTMTKILKKKEEIDSLLQENFSIFRLLKLIHKVWRLQRYQSEFKDSDFYKNIFKQNQKDEEYPDETKKYYMKTICAKLAEKCLGKKIPAEKFRYPEEKAGFHLLQEEIFQGQDKLRQLFKGYSLFTCSSNEESNQINFFYTLTGDYWNSNFDVVLFNPSDTEYFVDLFAFIPKLNENETKQFSF